MTINYDIKTLLIWVIFWMEIDVDDLIKEIAHLIPEYSKRFYISEEGSRKFLKLAIIYLAKTEYKLETLENKIKGDKETLDKFISSVLSWDENEFDDEDFEIIGYCQNIR